MLIDQHHEQLAAIFIVRASEACDAEKQVATYEATARSGRMKTGR
jgi:hypothetical protein